MMKIVDALMKTVDAVMKTDDAKMNCLNGWKCPDLYSRRARSIFLSLPPHHKARCIVS